LKVFVLGFDPADAFWGIESWSPPMSLILPKCEGSGGASFSFSRVRLASWRD
jgi:hypothetical protein